MANEILVAGKSMVLLREIFEDFSQQYEKSVQQQLINVNVIGPAPTSLYVQFLQEVLEHFPQAQNKTVQIQIKPTIRIKLDSEMDLSPTAPFQGPISSYLGDEISPFLHYPDMDHGHLKNNSATTLFSPTPLPSLPNTFQVNFSEHTALPANSFTLQPVSVIMQKGVIDPIYKRYHAASQKLMKHLHEICMLHQHLVNIRAFFLMESGFAFHQFTLSLFEKVDRGEVLGTYELNRILQDSLVSVGKNESYLKKIIFLFNF